MLDIGCGRGESLRRYRALRGDLSLTGVDLLDFSASVPSGVTFAQVDLEAGRLPFADASFDAVTVNQVLEHVRTPGIVVAEIRRVLAPGGSLYIEVPNWITPLLPSWPWSLEHGGTMNFWDDWTHVRPYTRTALHFLLRHNGFEHGRIRTGSAVNSALRLASPLLILGGLLTLRRLWFQVGLMHLLPWAIRAEFDPAGQVSAAADRST